MRLYVKHCPLACPQRRPLAEKHLKDRGFTDVKWITCYPVDHPFVQWLHVRLGEYTSPPAISGLIKNLEAFKDLAEDPTISSAMFCDDDAVFIKDWKTKMDLPDGIPFVNLSVGVNFEILPDGKLRQLQNNGGCEVFWASRDFARFVTRNVDARFGLDHVFFAMMHFFRFPVLCSPIAQQTSILEPRPPSIETASKYTPTETWDSYVVNFKPTGLDYTQLWNESGIAREEH